ncbi:MAG: Pre-mRNA-splicing factor cef1 [Candelina submexicana]|nr:MAG: Pre-mRNA-splicing factor cef1 [Candelina submexicana]
MATPNPMVTPFRQGGANGVGATPLRTPVGPGATPMRTPRDNFAINEENAMQLIGSTPREVKLRENSMRQQLKQRFSALPQPRETEWELELPEEQQEPVADVELSAEDAAERDRRNQQIREATERAEFKRRTQVLQRSLPRPSVVDVKAMLDNASKIKDPIEAAVAKEMALLIANDALKYPVSGGKIRGSSTVVELFDDTALNNARLEIALELPQGAAQKGSAELEQAWNDMHQSSELPGLASYGEDKIDEHQLLVEAFDSIQEQIMADAEQGNRTEKKLAVHLGGYQQRAKSLRQKIAEAAEVLEKSKTSLDTFRTLQIAEEAAIPRRLEALRSEVEFVAKREREAQEVYRARKEELNALSIPVNGVH